MKWQDEEGKDIKFDTQIKIEGNEKKVIKVYPVFRKQIVITYFVEGKVFTTDTIDKDDTEYKIPLDPIIYDANRYFVYWTTSKDEKGIGTGQEYNDESLKKDIAAGKTDITLYAKTEFKHMATFITGEGASFQEQILADKDKPLDTVPEDPTREGYKFSHWSLTKDGQAVDLSTYKLEKDITVYAVWTPIVVDYKFKVMVQNIDDDGYTFHEIISARGLNGDKTTLPYKGAENSDPNVRPSGPIVADITSLTEKDGRFNDSYNSKDSNGKMDHKYTNKNTLDYPGFHLNEEKTAGEAETIEADGSTVVPVYMDRNVHTIWVYKNANKISYYQANWVNATDENGNIHVDLRYGQSSEKWFDKLDKDYIYYMDKSIGSFYTRAPAMGDKDIYMYRVLAKGTKYQLRFVEWDPSKFNAGINSSDLATMQSTLGTMKEIGKRVSFQNSEWYMNWNGSKYRVFEPYNGNYGQITYSWVDKTDHVDDIEGFEPKKGDMSRDGLQSVNVNNPAFRDYMFAAGKNVGGYQNYTGTPYMENGNYVGFLFYIRKSYKINYYSGNDKLASKSYKYEAPVTDFGLNYEVGKTINPENSKEIFKGWYKDSTFSVPYTAEDIKTMPAHDTNVYAKWEAVEYKVTFHTNQSNYSDEKYIEEVTNIPDSKTIYDGQYKGAKASEENLPKEVKPNEYAKEFLDWYEKDKYGRYVRANLYKAIRNNNTHLYAKWVYEYLNLKYDFNLVDGDNVVGIAPTDSESYIKDAKAQVKDIGEVTVNGGKKVFVGWSESKDGSTGLIKPSETVLMDKNKTLYAQWKEVYNPPLTRVTYDPNGGKGSQYTVDKIIVEDFHKVLDNDTDENLKYSREGYVFKGWSRDKNRTTAEFQKGEEVNVNQLDQDKNNFIYAIWAPIINYTTDGNGQVKEGENFVDKTKEEVELTKNPKGTETKANVDYKFSHWTADKEITLNDGTKIPAGGKITEEQLKQAVITEPLTFKANFVQDKFKVKHEFKVADDSPVKEMPADVKTAVDAQLPDAKTAENGTNAKPGELKNPTDVEDKTNDGTWTFEGFKDQNPDTTDVDAKVNGKDVTFEGSWKFTPNKHEVIHKFVSKDPNKELPKEVTDLLPANQPGKEKGNEVNPTTPTETTVKVKDGTWKFVGYDKDSKTVDNKDVEFTGKWEFTPDPAEYKVDHKFVSSTKGKDLPKAVTDLLPKEQTGKTDGETVTPTAPEQTEVVDTENDGTWTFEGFKDQDPDTTDVDAKVNGKDVTFEGSWKFTPNKHEVTYEFVSDDKNIKLPDEVKNLLPDPEKGKVKGDKVTPTKPIPTSITTKDGVWTFVKYDKDSGTIDDKNFVFTGTWKFSPKPDPTTYNVNHQFKSATEGKELPQAVKDLLPVQQTGKKDGDIVIPSDPKQNEVVDKENDGKWNFKGYKDLDTTTKEKVDAKVDGADVMFEGSWEYTPNKHKVTYEYVSGTNGVDLPEVLKNKAPEEATGKVKGDTVTSPIPTGDDATFRDDVNKGTWKFKSFDKDSLTISNQDEKVTGTWEFTPDPVTEFVDEDGNAIAPKENGKQTNKDIDGYEFVRTETDDKGNTKHIYKKKTTPPTTEVVTEYVDENGNTISPKENGKQTNKDIDGYEFVRTETDDKGNIKHIYKKKTTTPTEIVTEFVDEDGNAIAPKENGKQTNKDIDGYEFVRTETDDKGNTKHIYKKKTTPPTTEVVTEYVDENGNTISPKENGKQTNKDIVGYEFVRTETDDKGNTKHIYKKKTTTPEVFTKFVDENGLELSDTLLGKNPSKAIPGYEIVRTETDSNGNIIYVYKKKAAENQNINKSVDRNGNEISKSTKNDNPQTGRTDSDNVLILLLMGSAIALHKIRKYR